MERKMSMSADAELEAVERLLATAIELGGLIHEIESSVPRAMTGINDCVSALMVRKRELETAEPLPAKGGAHAFYK